MTKSTKKKLILSLCAGFLLTPVIGECSSAENFKTREYFSSTGLELINAADAFALGYTGKNIKLGIADTYVKLSHPEFINKKYSATIATVPYDYDWQKDDHGTHVAGIMAANKDGLGMHGVAFDAELLSGDLEFDNPQNPSSILEKVYAKINADTQIKAINNSWGSLSYADEHGSWTKEEVLELLLADNDYTLDILSNSITNHDKILVFCTHNNGHSTPALSSLLPYLKPETAKNFINVTAINHQYFDKVTQKASSGFITYFSDLTKYVEENSIAAPGYKINSTFAVNDKYISYSGTSMATPYVTGTVGLVQQAFPYMTSKQIVDTVLSSANNSFSLPEYSLTFQSSLEDTNKINLYYHGIKPDDNIVKQDLLDYYKNHPEYVKELAFSSLQEWEDSMDEYLSSNSVIIYENVPREMLFGQGILDAGAAVRGPGLFNARRMDKNNLDTIHLRDQALYAIDTQGYNSIWSNNIGEKQAGLLSTNSQYDDLKKIHDYYLQGDIINDFDNGQQYINAYNAKATANNLLDLSVGLLKLGEGTLTLTGTNTYTGSSIVAGGVLQIDGSVASDAWSEKNGTIAGSGTIAENLYNYATVQAGSWGIPKTLTVGGDFISDGKISIITNEKSNSMLNIQGTTYLNSSRFINDTGSIYNPEKDYTVLNSINGIQGTIGENTFTGMLNATGDVQDNNLIMKLSRHNNLGTINSIQQISYNSMDAMYTNLHNNSIQREMDILYSLDSGSTKQALTEIYGGTQANLAANIQKNSLMGNAITARFAQVKRTNNIPVSIPVSGFANSMDIPTILPLELDAKNSWWLKMSKDWSEVNASAEMSGNKTHGFAVTIGKDVKVNNNWRVGGLFNYGTTNLSTNNGQGETQDYRLGIYGGYEKGALDLTTYLNYGRQNNEVTRYLPTLGLKANSDYNSNTWDIGIKASYDLQYKKDKVWLSALTQN